VYQILVLPTVYVYTLEKCVANWRHQLVLSLKPFVRVVVGGRRIRLKRSVVSVHDDLFKINRTLKYKTINDVNKTNTETVPCGDKHPQTNSETQAT
jgi:hypothetical protein